MESKAVSTVLLSHLTACKFKGIHIKELSDLDLF